MAEHLPIRMTHASDKIFFIRSLYHVKAVIALIQQSWREASTYVTGSMAEDIVITKFLCAGDSREYESTELRG